MLAFSTFFFLPIIRQCLLDLHVVLLQFLKLINLFSNKVKKRTIKLLHLVFNFVVFVNCFLLFKAFLDVTSVEELDWSRVEPTYAMFTWCFVLISWWYFHWGLQTHMKSVLVDFGIFINCCQTFLNRGIIKGTQSLNLVLMCDHLLNRWPLSFLLHIQVWCSVAGWYVSLIIGIWFI